MRYHTTMLGGYRKGKMRWSSIWSPWLLSRWRWDTEKKREKTKATRQIEMKRENERKKDEWTMSRQLWYKWGGKIASGKGWWVIDWPMIWETRMLCEKPPADMWREEKTSFNQQLYLRAQINVTGFVCRLLRPRTSSHCHKSSSTVKVFHSVGVRKPSYKNGQLISTPTLTKRMTCIV